MRTEFFPDRVGASLILLILLRSVLDNPYDNLLLGYSIVLTHTFAHIEVGNDLMRDLGPTVLGSEIGNMKLAEVKVLVGDDIGIATRYGD